LFTGSAILEERITFGYFRFNDGTFEELNPYLKPDGDAPAFMSRWSMQASELATADALRLLETYAALLPSSEPGDGPTHSTVQEPVLHARLLGVKHFVSKPYSTDTLLATVREVDPHFGPDVERAWEDVMAVGIRYLTSRY
jgi:hypothetical protein